MSNGIEMIEEFAGVALPTGKPRSNNNGRFPSLQLTERTLIAPICRKRFLTAVTEASASKVTIRAPP